MTQAHQNTDSAIIDFVGERKGANDANALIEACSRSQAMIRFALDGTIVTANQNFLDVMGYTLDEIRGKHHRMFVDPAEHKSAEYRVFWAQLARGEYQAREYKRLGKGGREVWIQASYNPVMDESGTPVGVLKVATEITSQKLENADYAGQIEAIGKSQAVIEFMIDGTIVTANQNFLDAMGYTLDEIRGKHHRIFVDPAEHKSAEYRAFWAQLARGEYQAREYKRLGKGGREVWIQASYNPILDLSGKPFKVVKYATDVTRQAQVRKEVEGIVRALASAAKELHDLSQMMSANATETVAQASMVSAGAEQVSVNVQTVSHGTREMEASIREISQSAQTSAKVASKAVESATKTSSTMEKLRESSAEIGKVVKVISSIAHQTNLLALNATIEAARAGNAGRGFAIVANEVKELAKQTANATEEISRKIEAIQADTLRAVDAIGAISSVISEVNGISVTIAGAVEEQTATTKETSRNLGQAALSSSEIASNIGGVASAARETASGAEQMAQASGNIGRLAQALERAALS